MAETLSIPFPCQSPNLLAPIGNEAYVPTMGIMTYHFKLINGIRSHPAFIPSNYKELDQQLNSLLEYPSQLEYHHQDKRTQTYRSKISIDQITREGEK